MRLAYQLMMRQRTKTEEEINEMIEVYFKKAKTDIPNWDEFDAILQQIAQAST